MPERIPQSVTLRVPLMAYLSTDHLSPATGKTIPITISKNGAAFGNPSGGATNATEIANGAYYVDLSTTDTGTVGPLFVYGVLTGVDTIMAVYDVQVFTTFPTNFASLSIDGNGRVDVTKINGTSQTARDIGASVLLSTGTGTGQLDLTSGVVKANVTQMASGVIAAATFAANALDAVWSTTIRALTDKANFTLSAAGVQAIWDVLTSALVTVNSIGKLLVDNINATISSRLASASYTAPDNATIGTINTNLTTLINRVGAFTGTGVNTVLGFLKALLNKAASTPSDIGGTFDPSTDSTEALRDQLGTAANVALIPTNPLLTNDSRLPGSGVISKAGDQMDLVNAPNPTAVAAIQSGLATTVGQTTINNNVTAVGSAVSGVQSDTDNIQTRLPAALVGGRIDASAGDITQSALAKFFTQDSGEDFGDAVVGSIVRETADNASSDQWSVTGLNNVSEYPTGTAGYELYNTYLKTLLIGAGSSSVLTPVNAVGSTLTFVRGDDYIFTMAVPSGYNALVQGQAVTLALQKSDGTWQYITGVATTTLIMTFTVTAVETRLMAPAVDTIFAILEVVSTLRQTPYIGTCVVINSPMSDYTP